MLLNVKEVKNFHSKSKAMWLMKAYFLRSVQDLLRCKLRSYKHQSRCYSYVVTCSVIRQCGQYNYCRLDKTSDSVASIITVDWIKPSLDWKIYITVLRAYLRVCMRAWQRVTWTAFRILTAEVTANTLHFILFLCAQNSELQRKCYRTFKE